MGWVSGWFDAAWGKYFVYTMSYILTLVGVPCLVVWHNITVFFSPCLLLASHAIFAYAVVTLAA